MPISDDTLHSPKNSFVAVKGEATVGQAIAALQAEGGQPWWRLLVKKDDDSWGATTFSDLYEALADTPGAADMTLGAWDGLTAARAVAWDAMTDRQAEAEAGKSPGQLLIVMAGGEVKGIVTQPRRSAVVQAGKLTELGGTYVNLKDYGSILLSSSAKK